MSALPRRLAKHLAPPVTSGPRRTLIAPLLYWLLLVLGLVGLSIQRIDSPTLDWIDLPEALLPLWIGSCVGVAFGQGLAFARIRAWVPILVTLGSAWFLPLLYVLLVEAGGKGVETGLLAFLPAAVCGYLSLSERGALIAFWYPAVLWMMVILDAEGPVAAGVFDTRAALPFGVALAALFVAFLRARETRRAAIWASHGSVRIAPPRPRAVLQTTPLRTVSQHAFVALVGGASLVLASWVAPHLWKTSKTNPDRTTSVWGDAASASTNADSTLPHCCATDVEVPRERVHEYFPLLRGRAEQMRELKAASEAASCVPCTRHRRHRGWENDGIFGQTYVGHYEGYSDDERFAYGSGVVGSSGAGYSDPNAYVAPTPPEPPPTVEPPPVVQPQPQPVVTPPTPPPAKLTAPAVKAPKAAPATPPARAVAPSSPVAVHGAAPTPPVVAKPSASFFSRAAPWQWALAFVLGGLFVPVLVRAMRRAVMIRHLARPFWAETVDQRVSNHWQRVLIGLADAGIEPKSGEQPIAFARRIGLAGMETCATILERVRHGVRLEAGDVDAMAAAAGTAYAKARQKAGLAGRAAAWLRWPLA